MNPASRHAAMLSGEGTWMGDSRFASTASHMWWSGYALSHSIPVARFRARPWPIRATAGRLAHRVFERAQAVDLDAHGVARLQVFRRREADANARGRAGRDHVARVQRDAGGD